VTATGLTFPDFTCGIAAGIVANTTCICPEMVSISAGPPVYATDDVGAAAGRIRGDHA
jgi:hypothetical protein